MPAVKTKRISTLIETQLPEFITTEYELFSKFIQKYYEAQEVQGGTLDIINNIQKYADIDYYEKSILKQSDTLDVSIDTNADTVVLESARSFPKKNGYVRINNEIIFYESRTNTELRNCSRGVSGNTKLGDLYDQTNFQSTFASSHAKGTKVYNVSNLFLYAFIKNFETQYLGSFPEKYLKGEVDKRTLIKNIQKFYKSKGTDSSIKFIFNTIVAQDVNNKPEVYKPKDFTYKASESDWTNVFALKCKVISGDLKNLIGKRIVQQPTEEYDFSSAIVDNVFGEGKVDDEGIYNIVLAPETVNGSFAISTKTRLEDDLSTSKTIGNRINVFSTSGWDQSGSLLIGDEVIEFTEKTATQFIISKRDSPVAHSEGESVYKPVIIEGAGVQLLTLGVVYKLEADLKQPYSSPGDTIQISSPGFETSDVRIVDRATSQIRWNLNTSSPVSATFNQSIASDLEEVQTNVSAILADDEYYYITSSSYPSYDILDKARLDFEVRDQKLLRIIRKQPTVTTELYKTPNRDVGILVNGVPLYGNKDQESIQFGKLESISVQNRGRNYASAPFVLIDGLPYKARAVLNGQTVDRVEIVTDETFQRVPRVEVVSGRGAIAEAVVTKGEITSIKIVDPGEYYSSAPIVRITDNNGRGRFAEFKAEVNAKGEITGYTKLSGGSLYEKETVRVEILAVGEDAEVIPQLKTWVFNRYEKLKSVLDTQNGYLFENYNNVLKHGYAQIANPKQLRIDLDDNLGIGDIEPTVKEHSPILGFAYDGNPIYGPFGYNNPLSSASGVTRMTSSYSLNATRETGPNTRTYPLGMFIDDYTYEHRKGSLDENNGRFCVTPDYPEGTYAYFITIDSDQVPQFPYVLGDNFYSLPVDSNYNSPISQNEIPKNAKRLSIPGMPRNGDGVRAQIDEVKSGSVDRIFVDSSSKNFSVNNDLIIDNRGTGGLNASAKVSTVKGQDVSYLISKENKVVKLTTIQNAYLFQDDTLRQPASNARGTIVGTVADDNTIVLKDVVGTFNDTGTFSADIKTFILTVDQDSNYTAGAILSFTNGIDAPLATAEILEGTSRQNTVKIKQLSGNWAQSVADDTENEYFLQSSDFFNTSGSKVVSIVSLSDGLIPFDVNQKVALVETDSPHGVAIGDQVNVNIFPDDLSKVFVYQVRRRAYQTVKLLSFTENTTVNSTGVGRYTVLNGGADYTPKLDSTSQPDYRWNVPLSGGSGTGATADIFVSSEGGVPSYGVRVINPGSGYKKGDYLSVDDDQLERSGASLSTQRLTIYVDHVGISKNREISTTSDNRKIPVQDVNGFATGDIVKIGDELTQISSIDSDNKILVVNRGYQETEPEDIYDGASVTLFQPQYNIPVGTFRLSANFATLQSYDNLTQTAVFAYDYSVSLDQIERNKITNTTTFFDESTPPRLVKVAEALSVEQKFEFAEPGGSYVANPNIDIQEYYRYRFDTSHSSLTGTFLDFSPSLNYNLRTLESESSTISPGNPGSYSDVKFGFGPRTTDNVFDNKVGTDFTNFYYFDRNGIVNSEGAYLKIIDDPLQGVKTINYVTSNRFVYDIPKEPVWDGSGQISYTTNGLFAVGEINTVAMVNKGENYKKVPLVIGCKPSESFRGSATVVINESTNTIKEVKIDNLGSNYTNPIVIVTNADGFGATFTATQRNGELFSITVDNPGQNYTYPPEIEIVESSVKLFAESDEIGLPTSISISNNGGAFHLDKTVSSEFTSQYTVSLKDFQKTFLRGEKVYQKEGSQEVFSAIVSSYDPGSNLIKLRETKGIIRENVTLYGQGSTASGTVQSIFVSTFTPSITSFYDNIGSYSSDRGKLGAANQRLTDGFFYQDYSYVVKSKTSIEQWRDLIKSTTHPAGFLLFGQVDVETSAAAEMPTGADTKADTFSIIQIWDPDKNRITVESTKQVTTQTIQILENTRIRKGQGSVSSSEYNFNETRAFDFKIYNTTPGFYDEVIADGKDWWIKNPFDGYFDEDGRLRGSTIFQVRDEFDRPFTPLKEEVLIVTLDGILQEPIRSYTVNQDKIVFAAPPLGPGEKQTGQSSDAVTKYTGTTFLGRAFYFKRSEYNARYIKKIRNIFQRNGRWIDAANQINLNKQFIIEEAIGYGKQYYPSLDWSTRLDDYQIDIGYLLDAYDHDIRFGGNAKTVDYSDIFARSYYISTNKQDTLGIFDYATKLANLAIRNWDVTENAVTYVLGSKKMTVSSTRNLVVGMYVSSGRSYDADTRIVSIDSATEITLSKSAKANSGGASGVSEGTTSLSGSTGGNDVTLNTNVGVVDLGNTYEVDPDDTLIVPSTAAGVDVATFSLGSTNNGTYYDAANLIASNKKYLQEEVSGYVYQIYSLPAEDQAKCHRDLGFLIDAIVYHLRFGGNERVINFAQLYYTNRGYPYGETLTYINRTAEETAAAIWAWNQLGFLMTQAMRNELGAGLFTSEDPVTDSNVLVDSENPVCSDVASSIDTFIGIVKDIIAEGTGIVEVIQNNPNKTGYWTTTQTYSNYNIIADPNLTNSECSDVISTVNSLYSNIEDIFASVEVEKNLPDFIDGETKDFELYWSDGSPVATEKDENLLLTLNAVLQESKFNESYPGESSYYIDRTVVPNLLRFDVAPIWDQYIGARTLGEPTAVERVTGLGIGNYKRLTIDRTLVDNVRKGPFLILDLEDGTVESIESRANLLVFVDGVLQNPEFAYEISGPAITFTQPITEQTKIDMRYLYGRDVGQILNLYDYNLDLYFAHAKINLTCTNVQDVDALIRLEWQGFYRGSKIQAFQVNPDNTRNTLGTLTNVPTRLSATQIRFEVAGQYTEINYSLPIYFSVAGKYDINIIIPVDSGTMEYEKDLVNNILLRGDDQNWRGTNLRKSYRNPFINLSNNSSIRVEGEDKFRKIKLLPSSLISKEGRLGQQVSNNYYGQVEIESYTGVTRGEGLSITPIMERDSEGNLTGRIERLDWNRRSYDPITQPTAYQYYTPPVINFIPKDGNGGGARAAVLVSKGQVISVELIDPGSGYTDAPDALVSRKYEIIEDTDIGISVIDLKINKVENVAFSVVSTISVLGNQVSGINTFTSILFRSPIESNREIVAIITPEAEQVSEDLSAQLTEPITLITAPFNVQVEKFDTTHGGTEVNMGLASADLEDPDSIVRFYSLSRQFKHAAFRQVTTGLQSEIWNASLSNVNHYEVGAFMELDLEVNENIIYVPDTSKFSSNGYLLVGKEIVRYYRKLNDRFLAVQRGQENTTESNWPAGTFLRQIPDPVSVVTGGIVVVESEAQVVTVQGGSDLASITEREREFEITAPTNTITTTERQIDLRIQKGLSVNSVQSVQFDIAFKVEPKLNVQTFNAQHNQTVVTAQVQTVQSDSALQSITTLVQLDHNITTDIQSVVQVEHEITTTIKADPAFDDVQYFVTSWNETTVNAQIQKVFTDSRFSDVYTYRIRTDINVAPITTESVVKVEHEHVAIVKSDPAAESVQFFEVKHNETTLGAQIQKVFTDSRFSDVYTYRIRTDFNIAPITTESIVKVEHEYVALIKSDPAAESVQFFEVRHNETTLGAQIQKVFTDSRFSDVYTHIIRTDYNLNVESESVVEIEHQHVAIVKSDPAADSVQLFDTKHNETFVKKFRDKFDSLLGTIDFDFDIPVTVVQVSVSPQVFSFSETTIETDAVSVRPSETVTVIDSVKSAVTNVQTFAQFVSVTDQITIRKDHLQVLVFTPPSGLIDGYEESLFINDPIPTRAGFVDVEENADGQYEVFQRDGDIIVLRNLTDGAVEPYQGTYEKTNAGHTIRMFDGIFDPGFANVSGYTIADIDFYFPTLTLNNFVERANSSYTLSGELFNIMPPSIQNPVTFATSGIDISNEMDVEETSYFPDSGYLAVKLNSGAFSGTISIISYTAKTTTKFQGCELYKGDGFPSAGDEIIPYTI